MLQDIYRFRKLPRSALVLTHQTTSVDTHIPLLYAHPGAVHTPHDRYLLRSALSTLQGLAIDMAGIGIFGWLLKRDLDARDKQIARMTREEDLGSLQIELANKKTLRLAQLRQFVRIVSCFLLLHF